MFSKSYMHETIVSSLVNTAIRLPIKEISEITRREHRRENPLIKRTRSEIPDFIGMWKQTLADQLIPSWRKPQQMHLKTHTAPRSSNKTQKRPQTNPRIKFQIQNHLVFFFEAESTGEETGMIRIRFYIRNASRLVQSNSLQFLFYTIRLEFLNSRNSEILTWYLRP